MGEGEGEGATDAAHMAVQYPLPQRRYVDSLYWSLTTMTTIGYGDRLPTTRHELSFVLFAQVFGLAFFAILITQINTVHEVSGASERGLSDTKNKVIQFLKHHDIDSEVRTYDLIPYSKLLAAFSE
eukprot:SAG11_NODE_7299_length_1165_cov_0.610694_2_plen_126_part_00